jgi:sigma-B regulation protein RsbU (phosphoserine phosphatase)
LVPSDAELLEARNRQLAIAIAALRSRDRKAAQQAEWDFALQLQTDGLPQEFPAFPDRPEFDIRAGMITAREVGGDVYDFFLLDRGRLAVLVADACGKGLPAASYIAQTRTLLRAAAEQVPDPGECLTTLNDLMAFDNPDTATGAFGYANAGHPPPLLVRPDGTVSALPGRSRPMLGVIERLVYPTEHFVFAPGETLVGFSDGVIEAHDPAKALFGEERLARTLQDTHGQDAATMLAAVIQEVDRFIGLAPIADDVTLLLLRWNGFGHQLINDERQRGAR